MLEYLQQLFTKPLFQWSLIDALFFTAIGVLVYIGVMFVAYKVKQTDTENSP